MEDLKLRHDALVTGRNLRWDNFDLWCKELDSLDREEVSVLIYRKEDLKPITTKDFAYYFGALIHHIKHSDFFIDHSPEAVHHRLMEMFWAEKIVTNGKEDTYVPHLAKFNQRQYKLHCDKVKHFAAEDLGIKLLDRDEYYATKKFRMS
jgi:hypothetical protein